MLGGGTNLINSRSDGISHQLGNIRHGIWLPISNSTSAKIKPALRVALGFHALGDGSPVVDFGLVHWNGSTCQCWKPADGSAPLEGGDNRHLNRLMLNLLPKEVPAPPQGRQAESVLSFANRLYPSQ